MLDPIFTPRALLGVVNKRARLSSFFLDTFFPNVYTFRTEKVSLDVIDDAVDSAMFIAPEVDGQVIKTRGYETRDLTPASLKPKHMVDPKKTLKRLPGEAVNGSLSQAQRREAVIVQNIMDEEKAIAQTEEWMASQAVIFGQYTCEGTEFEKINVDFGRSAANNITLTGAALWSAQDKATYDPCVDITNATAVCESGVNIAVFDQAGYNLFISFKKVTDKLETRRGSSSALETALKDLGKDVSIKGYLGDVLIVVYTGYRIVNGTKAPYMPANTVVLGHSDYQGARLYGAILDDDAIKDGLSETDRYPKVYSTVGDVSRTFTVLKSAPLMATPNPDEFVTITFA
ncbi:major capsid protein [Pseudoalteromonas ulvae]|uniref:Major capsid protein E n=1 Tax=Pseudoalteromonas ulvae TaxID=107327 RepID=A0A244CUJ3_PSEDV|nr:major capsid protein [Pseudoalteromonas ulvae]OUL59261.1 hypothetical protein B1199_03050 [Pseudoalteromonas ulvae]